MNKHTYEERLEWAYIEGTDLALEVYKDPIGNVDIWGKAKSHFNS